MNPIQRYDEWVRGRVKAVLDWLYEWLSISQKVVERSLIAAYVIGRILEMAGVVLHESHEEPLWVIVFVAVFFAGVLWRIHTEPSTVRTTILSSLPIFLPLKMMWQLFAFLAIISIAKGRGVYDIGWMIDDVTWVLLWYVFSVNSDGEKGRKRKMAWAKLKELFAWLPEPQPEGV
jgi:hypothetical protein